MTALGAVCARGTAVTASRVGGARFVDTIRTPDDLVAAWFHEGSPFLRAVRRPIAGVASDLPLAERLVAWGVPPWWAPSLARRDPAFLARWLPVQQTRPPLWAWGRQDAADLLRRDGWTVREVHGALQITGDRPVESSRAWREGLLEVQDLGSQQVADLVAAAPGEAVWDACAGTGGKTVRLAATMAGKGVLHATDVSTARLDRLRQRVRRAGLQHVRVGVWDGEAPIALPREVARRGGFDAVLVDAPCSGSGTWRRNPDARVRQAPGPQWAALQHTLLAQAAPAVRPGGRLVYATCSVCPEEDEDVVAAFLAAHPAYTLVHQGLHGAPEVDADTLFAAVCVRAAAS
ncbi:MAG: RsmB/NOP family class I SAM-dependent RNA methyltransferase [Alphaproteobacteria bacterium]|nr:RsmB/NOP family class I SAM-dependent RNA methyltransferase [Alphaproteobacteria bacterium]